MKIRACDNYTRPKGIMGGSCMNCGRSQPEHVHRQILPNIKENISKEKESIDSGVKVSYGRLHIPDTLACVDTPAWVAASDHQRIFTNQAQRIVKLEKLLQESETARETLRKLHCMAEEELNKKDDAHLIEKPSREELLRFVEGIACYDRYTHDDISQIKILADIELAAQKLWYDSDVEKPIIQNDDIRDAERYRFLRRRIASTIIGRLSQDDNSLVDQRPEHMDELIDARMTKIQKVISKEVSIPIELQNSNKTNIPAPPAPPLKRTITEGHPPTSVGDFLRKLADDEETFEDIRSTKANTIIKDDDITVLPKSDICYNCQQPYVNDQDGSCCDNPSNKK